MSDAKRQILEMLADGTITQEDAERLLEALGDETEPAEVTPVNSATPVPPMMESVKGAMKEAMTVAKEALSSAKHAVSKLSQIDTKLSEQGRQEFPCEGLENINVQWAACGVQVQNWNGTTVRVTEYANRPLEEGECMVARDDNGTLTILWSEETQNRILGALQKRLVIDLPEGLAQLDTLEIHTGSAEIQWNTPQTTFDTVDLGAGSGAITVSDSKADTMEVGAGSGAIALSQVQCDSLNGHTGSGSIHAENLHAETVELGSGSGSVKLTANELPECVELHSVSGAVTVTLPQEPQGGFTVSYDTVTGRFQSDFPLAEAELGMRSGSGTYGDGACELKMRTTTGSMKIKRV